MGKIGLIDVDSHNFPNIPLMKISAFYKQKGADVSWYSPLSGTYDQVFVSKIFSFTPDYKYPIAATKINKGGSGYAIRIKNGREIFDQSVAGNLPDEIEHIYPDYNLYPTLTKDKAFGFLTRGCPRQCGFCHVAKKEGLKSVKVAELAEFWRGQKEIVLCDPNLLACKERLAILAELAETQSKVELNQGIDIRLLNKEVLKLLKKIKLKNIRFAFDRWQDREIIKKNLKDFKEATGYNHNKGGVLVYILVNYDTTLDQDIDRIMYCRELGFSCLPMIYNKNNCDLIYHKMQRWCNNYIFWRVPSFREYLAGINDSAAARQGELF